MRLVIIPMLPLTSIIREQFGTYRLCVSYFSSNIILQTSSVSCPSVFIIATWRLSFLFRSRLDSFQFHWFSSIWETWVIKLFTVLYAPALRRPAVCSPTEVCPSRMLKHVTTPSSPQSLMRDSEAKCSPLSLWRYSKMHRSEAERNNSHVFDFGEIPIK